MSEEDFQESVRRSIPRHAADYVRRGLWAQEKSLESMKEEFSRLLPNGRETLNKHFAKIIDAEKSLRVGETWYLAQEQGGKLRFWIDWIWIDLEHRRKGYATSTLLLLEEEARKLGADRVGLNVWFDNPGAIALYSKLGYVPASMSMMKLLNHAP